MRIPRPVKTLLATAGAAALLVGCSAGGNLQAPDPGASEAGWNDPTADLTGVTLRYGQGSIDGPTTQVLDAFEEATGVTIERVAYPDPYEQTLQTQVATGDKPDLAAWQPTESQLNALQAPTNLLPLDDAPWLDEIDPALRDITGFVGDTRYAALVSSPAVMGVYYNKAAFAQAGITEPPQDWADFVADAETLRAAGTTPFFEAGGAQWPTQWWVQVQLAEAAQDGLWDRVNTAATTFTDPPIIDAITEYQRLTQAGLFNDDLQTATFEDQAAALMAGDAAMAMQVGALLELIQTTHTQEQIDQTIGWFPISKEGTTATSIPDNKNGVVVFRTGDAQREAAAKQLLNFWMTTDYEDYITTNGIVSIKPDVPSPDTVTDVAQANADALVDSVGSMQSLAVANPDLYINLASMLYGEVTPEQVGQATQNQFAQLAAALGAEGF